MRRPGERRGRAPCVRRAGGGGSRAGEAGDRACGGGHRACAGGYRAHVGIRIGGTRLVRWRTRCRPALAPALADRARRWRVACAFARNTPELAEGARALADTGPASASALAAGASSVDRRGAGVSGNRACGAGLSASLAGHASIGEPPVRQWRTARPAVADLARRPVLAPRCATWPAARSASAPLPRPLPRRWRCRVRPAACRAARRRGADAAAFRVGRAPGSRAPGQ